MGPVMKLEGVGKRFRRYSGAQSQSIVQALAGGRPGRGAEGYFWVLRNVEFEVMPGEMLGIVGRNGVGKSTLLSMMAGLMRPDEGRIRLHGQVSALLDLGRSLHPRLTGRENIRTAALLNGLTRAQADARVDEIAAFTELGGFLGAPVRTYSSGMKARLAFSVAVHVEPRILLIDEFLFVGDQFFQAKCLDRIRSLMREGTAVLLTSHIAQKISDHCDRALWLASDGVRAIGQPDDILARYQAHQQTGEASGRAGR